MPNRREHHIVHNSLRGGWDVKASGGKKSVYHADTKADAVKRGREISRNQNTEMIVHKLDGKIQYCDSHGKDPYPPRG